MQDCFYSTTPVSASLSSAMVGSFQPELYTSGDAGDDCCEDSDDDEEEDDEEEGAVMHTSATSGMSMARWLGRVSSSPQPELPELTQSSSRRLLITVSFSMRDLTEENIV